MFSIGEFVFDTVTNAKVQVLEKIEMWGYVSYKVFNSATGKVHKVTEAQLAPVSTDVMKYDENYLRYVMLLAKIKNETAGGFLASLASGVIPLPHQLHVLDRVMESNNIRYILADEVGLGKTIEAGMVIKELKARGLIQRVLVVCPTGLVTQWASEMEEKFHEKFHVILPSDFDTIKRITDTDDVYGQFDKVISPMDSIKPIEHRAGWDQEKIEKYNQDRIYSIINSGWDLIIIDEAHRVAGSSSEVARYKLGYLLSQASPYLLLLSATPHNGSTDAFLRLVRLLDEMAFPNAKSIVKEQVAPFVIRTEKREAIDDNGNKLFKKRITHLEVLNWDERHSLQRELYERVSEYVAKNYNKALRNRKKNMCIIFLMIIMQRMLTSSVAAVRNSLERRLFALRNQETRLTYFTEEDLADMDIEEGLEEAITALSLDIKNEILDLEDIIALAKRAQNQYPDVKVEKLQDTLDKIFYQNKDQKVIIFTEFVATQQYLAELLRKQGHSVTILNGSMNMDERNAALKEFREETSIFISTDAGGEGLNLQFSSIIINYDLPWNPMKIEQRCGRVDRIGQNQDVHIYNFIIEDTIENRVREKLENKLAVILAEMGVDKFSDVLDSESAEWDFTKAYMGSIGKKNPDEVSMYAIESEMKSQLANANKYKGLIKEEKDLTQLVGKESNFDVEQALKQMLTYYDRWHGKDSSIVDRLSINDEAITEHLKADLVQDQTESIMCIKLEDMPHEAGYFMLWELSISDDDEGEQIIPIFVNKDYVLRPVTGKRLMEAFLKPSSKINVTMNEALPMEVYERLQQLSMESTYDTFVNMREKQLKKNQESYDKYMYALKLRMEAAEHIGIDNIRKARLAKMAAEKAAIEKKHKLGKQIFPEFRLVLMAKLEE
ncbi:MAG: helicase-related protein [Phascolarctobacterium sp.]|nr:helicase-related protein [Phascolarctobacterium sp.]